MSRPSITEFVDADGVRHELRDPDSAASAAQLRVLNAAGRLQLVDAGAVPPVTKGEAAFAVHTEVTAGRVQLRPRRSPADAAKTWEAIVAHVQQHPGCTLTDLRAVRGRHEYVRERLQELVDAGVVVNTGRGRRLELWHRDDPRRPRSST